MKKEISIPLKSNGTDFTDENKKRWNTLSKKEKLLYQYLIENDTNLSAILVGVFSAYVVNDVSNLISLEPVSWYYMIPYCLNVIFAVRTLILIIELYLIHIRKERRDKKDTDTVYINESFSRLFTNNRNKIKELLNKLKIPLLGILITLISCFVMRNIL